MLTQQDSIGFIGGGQMAEALIKGMLLAKIITEKQISVVEPVEERRSFLKKTYGISTLTSPETLCQNNSVLLFAIKPQLFNSVIEAYAPIITPDHLVLSIMAGVNSSNIENKLVTGCRIVRVMPNTPALVLAGASAFSANAYSTQEDRQIASQILSAVGSCIEVPEMQMDAVTGLSGSGPGYIFTIIDALVDGGVLAGLPRSTAEELVLQTIYGSAKLALENKESNASGLKAQVTSPGGTTIRGIHALEKSGIRAALMEAVQAATDRSRELGG